MFYMMHTSVRTIKIIAGWYHGCLKNSDYLESQMMILAMFLSRQSYISHHSLNWRCYRLEITCLENKVD